MFFASQKLSPRIYSIWQSTDERRLRPDGVTYYDPKGKYKTRKGFKKFQDNCLVSAGREGHSIDCWFIPELYASVAGETPIEDWDFYLCATFGAFSPRAIDVLSPFLGNRFAILPARLEGHDYYCLRCQSRLACLDKTGSQLVYLDEDAEEVLTIEKHAFRTESIDKDMIFAIPESVFGLYCTDAVPKAVKNARLKGFDFRVVTK